MFTKPKQCKTYKLHYGEYLYKLVLSNSLNVFFRSELQKKEKLSYARENLDKLTESYRNNEPLTRKVFRAEQTIPLDDYFDALDLYKILKNNNDYKIRIHPYQNITIYSNNKTMLSNIIQKMRISNREFWEPDENSINLLKEKTNIEIVNKKPVFPIKIYFNSKRVPRDFSNWINANTDKCRIGGIALESLESFEYLNNYYMYVRDEKVLDMISLLIGHAIRRVDKLVYNEDKY